MKARIQKWGNSLAVRIPRGFAAETGLEAGTEVDMKMKDGEIRISPVPPPEYRLEDLVSRITPENLHGEVNTGPAAGSEAW